MNLSTVVTTLSAITEIAGRVAITPDLESATDYIYGNAPACVVVSPAESADPTNHVVGGVRQTVSLSFGVLVTVNYAGTAGEKAAMTELETLVALVQGALIGMELGPEYDPLLFTGGRIVVADQSRLAWLCEYQTTYLLEG